jgi:hypothetical protein
MYYVLALKEIPAKGKRSTKHYEYSAVTHRVFGSKRDALFYCHGQNFKYPIIVQEDHLPRHLSADELIEIHSVPRHERTYLVRGY